MSQHRVELVEPARGRGVREALARALEHALARWNRGDYGALNRLHRLRNELSTAALAHAALALAAVAG